MIDRLQLCGPLKNSETILNIIINANLIVYISVPIKDFIHNYHRVLFNDIPGSGRTLTTYPGRDVLLLHARVGTPFNNYIPGSRAFEEKWEHKYSD